jgi:hypothetical protein
VPFFAQPIVAYLLQGFVDVSEQIAPATTLRIEAGRQLFGLGAERLVGTRYGPNVPLPFIGVRAILRHDRERVILLYQRPVDTRPET